MKKNIFIIALLAITPIFVQADPAKKVQLSYSHGVLKIVAEHPVKDVNTHYIDLIAITVDGKEVKVIKPTKQSSAEAEVVELAVPEITPSSTIKVKTRCNLFGTKSATLKLK